MKVLPVIQSVPVVIPGIRYGEIFNESREAKIIANDSEQLSGPERKRTIGWSLVPVKMTYPY